MSTDIQKDQEVQSALQHLKDVISNLKDVSDRMNIAVVTATQGRPNPSFDLSPEELHEFMTKGPDVVKSAFLDLSTALAKHEAELLCDPLKKQYDHSIPLAEDTPIKE